jgi:hypothetical protein
MHYLCFWYELKQCIGTMVLSGLELSEVHMCILVAFGQGATLLVVLCYTCDTCIQITIC